MAFFNNLRALASKLASPFGHPTQVHIPKLASTCVSVFVVVEILVVHQDNVPQLMTFFILITIA